MRILITGGAGSWGSQLSRHLMKQGHTVCIYSRDEEKHRRLQAQLGPELRCFIGDVRDHDRLRRAMQGCDRVVHLAAMKQIDACTYNPIEAVRTNIDGTINVIDAAIDEGVSRVLCMSTDKAVEPTTLYGQTKAVVESLVRNAGVYGKTHFVALRCGNAWGSTGSVVPLWKSMLAQGVKELPVTHLDCTRYTVPLEATPPLITWALDAQVPNGSILVPTLRAYRIVDIATALGAQIKEVGLRPGEKIHESMVGSHEACDDRGCIIPGHQPRTSAFAEKLTVDELKDLIHA